MWIWRFRSIYINRQFKENIVIASIQNRWQMIQFPFTQPTINFFQWITAPTTLILNCVHHRTAATLPIVFPQNFHEQRTQIQRFTGENSSSRDSHGNEYTRKSDNRRHVRCVECTKCLYWMSTRNQHHQRLTLEVSSSNSSKKSLNQADDENCTKILFTMSIESTSIRQAKFYFSANSIEQKNIHKIPSKHPNIVESFRNFHTQNTCVKYKCGPMPFIWAKRHCCRATTVRHRTILVEYVRRVDRSRSEHTAKERERENKERKWLLHCQISNVVAGDVTIPTNVLKRNRRKSKRKKSNFGLKNVDFRVKKWWEFASNTEKIGGNYVRNANTQFLISLVIETRTKVAIDFNFCHRTLKIPYKKEKRKKFSTLGSVCSFCSALRKINWVPFDEQKKNQKQEKYIEEVQVPPLRRR